MVAVGTVLIEHEIIDPKDKTTRTAISKLWPVYCVPGMTMHFLFTRQLLQSGLSIEGTMDGSTFCNSSGDAVLSALPNLWGSIQVMRTCIIKNNVSNLVSLVTRHPDYETIHHHLGHISDEAIRPEIILKVLRRSASLTRSMYAAVALWKSCTSTVSLRTLSILVRLLDWSIQISLSSPLYYTLSISCKGDWAQGSRRILS